MATYLNQIINKYHIAGDIDFITHYNVISPLESEIKEWAGYNLNKTFLSGSRAKGTAINLSSDFDLFISLNSSCNNTLKEIYLSLYDYMLQKGYNVRKQNVSLGLEFKGHSIDLVPSKKHLGHTNYHSLYKNKTDTWTQTNVEQHIRLIRESGRTNEIILLKIWRRLHDLDFPSMYLELFVINKLKYHSTQDIENNFWYLLGELAGDFKSLRIIDPSNTNNVISNDLTESDKNKISLKAKESRTKKFWSDIVW